ncbi:hypothetical protein MNEG_0987 [Monoraphidium neglectum]|uniref:Cytochrome P450 n=1 Tax=Monoraphidium neglectum TaxID=145388 RepID=A0A0D2K9M9_9CHLO|nr:hypothetical protein MNEG_0987 [Monoraphidium neglectum]KIZ06958.1 hypothetical protein MNEG_0987 [Monoraphidium neglectum]|eukprot:XP_013905977.1 hypothetical protein MNEG_0987 [Monoraphidium neglectum]
MPNEVTEGYRYLPFGGGRRKCVGDQFALFEAVVGLSMLLRRFEFERAPDAPPVGMTTGATIHTTNGLWMSIKQRQNKPPGPPAAATTPLAPASKAPAGPPVPALAAAAVAAAEAAPAAADGKGASAGGCPFAAAFGGAGQQQQQQQGGEAGAVAAA